MYKKIIKGVLVSVSVVFFALIIGYVTYYGAMNFVSHNLSNSEANNSAEAVLSDTVPEQNESSAQQNDQASYFLAKLSGDKIEIYSCDAAENSQFLYSFSVYVPDIPYDDAEALRRGIRFNTKEELLLFEEDYNS